jgi:hypothetical protein
MNQNKEQKRIFKIITCDRFFHDLDLNKERRIHFSNHHLPKFVVIVHLNLYTEEKDLFFNKHLPFTCS